MPLTCKLPPVFKTEFAIANGYRTSTGIDPVNLAPVDSKGKFINRRVDYGYALNVSEDDDPEFIAEIEKVWHKRGEKPDIAIEDSISQGTTHEVRERPIYCSIEVKTPSSNKDPTIQLAVWTAAGFKRWQQIGSQSNVPFVFCWSIKGSMWQLHIARNKSALEMVS